MNLTDARKNDLGLRKRFRMGRGPGSDAGKFCGKGIKGAQARSGYGVGLTYEGGQMPLFRRMPKRGFNNFEFADFFAPVNVVDAAKKFAAGATVTEEDLRKAGLVHGEAAGIKILAKGALTAALHFKVSRVSASARGKIEAAGGSVEETNPVKPHHIRKGRRSKVAAKLKAAAQKADKKGAKTKGEADAE
ncbi:MAG: 50S ribosomal protein L15 [Planctomycetota bacterium]